VASRLPGATDPLWAAIASLLAVIGTAFVAVWRDLKMRRRAKRAENGEEHLDIVWDHAGQLRQEYVKLLQQAQEREDRVRAELFEQSRAVFVKDDVIAGLKVREASRAARHNALVRRLLTEGVDGDDLELWPEVNGEHSSPKT
jgi:hypothetical protein